MKLDSVVQRHKFIDALVKKSFEIDKLLLHDNEHVDDWVANMEILTNLITIEKMIRTEKIFIGMIEEMDTFPIESAEKRIFLSMADEALNFYIDTVLCHTLDHALDALDNWAFRTTVGKKFRKTVEKKLTELSNKYCELYELYDEEPVEQDFAIKFDTSRDRLEVVLNFFKRGIQIDESFRNDDHPNFGDIMGLMATLEKLTALEDAINTEIFFEDAINDMLDVKDETKETRNKFFTPFAQQSERFMKNILVKRIEQVISFTATEYVDERLINFSAELGEAMVTLRKKYAEIYHV